MPVSIGPIQPEGNGWQECQIGGNSVRCDRCRRRLTSDERLYWRSVDYWSADGEFWCRACCNAEVAW